MTILKKFETDSILRKKIIILPIVVILAVSVLEIWVVNRLSTYGDQISQLQQREASLRMDNQLLENEIAEKASLIEIDRASKSLGYQKVKNFEYVSDLNLALNH